jgi:Ca2+-binding EF-hand superfamily protein
MRKFSDDKEAEYIRKEKDAATKSRLDPDDVIKWRAIFIKFDADGNGEFDASECKVLLQAVGVNVNERSMNDMYLKIFKEADEDHSDGLDFPEFLILIRKFLDVDFGGLASRSDFSKPYHPPEPKKKKSIKG